MMAQRSQRQFGNRSAVQIRHRAQRWLGGRAAIKLPRNFLRQRQGVEQRELREHIVRVLMIHQGFAMVGLSSLKEFGKSRMRRRERLSGKHLPEQDGARAHLVLLHQHAPVDRLGLARAAWPALLVVIGKDGAVGHELPPASHPHPLGSVH